MIKPINTPPSAKQTRGEKQSEAVARCEQRLGIDAPVPDVSFDPIENAMRQHPGLTREQAEELAVAFGF